MRYSRLKHVLDEVRFEDQYTAGALLRKYPNDYVHFGGGKPNRPQRAPWTPKFGINPRPGHSDPPGLYLYPISWILKHSEGDVLYRMDSSHLAIVKFDSHKRGVLNLNNDFALEDFQKIAEYNGWSKYYKMALKSPGRYLRGNNMDPELWEDGRPGPVFYATADALVNAPRVFGEKTRPFKWTSLLRNVKALKDEGEGIINTEEPAQVVAIDPGVYRILEVGENKINRSVQVRVFEEVIRLSRGKIHGWRGKKLVGSFHRDLAPIKCMLIPGDDPFIEFEWKTDGKVRKFEFEFWDYLEGKYNDEEDVAKTVLVYMDMMYKLHPPSV